MGFVWFRVRERSRLSESYCLQDSRKSPTFGCRRLTRQPPCPIPTLKKAPHHANPKPEDVLKFATTPRELLIGSSSPFFVMASSAPSMAMRISVDTPRHGRISMEAPAMIRLAIFFFMVEGLMSSIMRLRSVCGFLPP